MTPDPRSLSLPPAVFTPTKPRLSKLSFLAISNGTKEYVAPVSMGALVSISSPVLGFRV
ncbi:MAG: hypothetical protein QXI36_01480 [Candidatus Bathyarchaeia archaeon]